MKKTNKKDEKIALFTLLAEQTKEKYSDQLDKIKDIFEFPVTIIPEWREKYVLFPESNVGKEVEQALVNYANAKIEGIGKRLNEKGNDLLISDKKIEVKSCETSNINTILQSSFYENNPNKFYAFASSTKNSTLEVRIINSQLLYRNALGDEIMDSLALDKTDNKLTKAIDEGLKTLDFSEMIKSSLINGKVNKDSKSFKIGKIRVRFILNIADE